MSQKNRAFHRLLLNGVPIDYVNAEGEPASDDARLVDFQNPDNNDFLVVNQFTITGTKRPRRPDLIAFVNGLPLATIWALMSRGILNTCRSAFPRSLSRNPR